MKVHIVRATRGIGTIYGIFDSREAAEAYRATSDAAIESYDVSRWRPRLGLWQRFLRWISWPVEVHGRYSRSRWFVSRRDGKRLG